MRHPSIPRTIEFFGHDDKALDVGLQGRAGLRPSHRAEENKPTEGIGKRVGGIISILDGRRTLVRNSRCLEANPRSAGARET